MRRADLLSFRNPALSNPHFAAYDVQYRFPIGDALRAAAFGYSESLH